MVSTFVDFTAYQRGNIFVNNHSNRGLENVVSAMKRRCRKLCVHITLGTAFGEGAS